MREQGIGYCKAKFFTWIIRFAPRWKDVKQPLTKVPKGGIKIKKLRYEKPEEKGKNVKESDSSKVSPWG